MKFENNPFPSEYDLHWGKADFIPYPVDGCPVPVFLDVEMETLVEKAVIDMEKVGMYKFLTLTY